MISPAFKQVCTANYICPFFRLQEHSFPLQNGIDMQKSREHEDLPLLSAFISVLIL